MPHVSINDLSVDFVIFGANSRSFKKQFVAQASGGRVMADAHDAVKVRALDRISLEIAHGDRIGLVGHNGSGKSTLLRVLSGIYKPTGGSLTITGDVGALLDPNAGMDADATGIENIYLRGYVLGMTKPEIRRHIDDIGSFTGLGNFLRLPLRTYSAGMFARLAFAISTVIRPDILLIDEGIGAGDKDFFDKMQARLGDFLSEASILVLASHDTNLITRFCNKRVILQQGKIIAVEAIEPPVRGEESDLAIDRDPLPHPQLP